MVVKKLHFYLADVSQDKDMTLPLMNITPSQDKYVAANIHHPPYVSHLFLFKTLSILLFLFRKCLASQRHDTAPYDHYPFSRYMSGHIYRWQVPVSNRYLATFKRG